MWKRCLLRVVKRLISVLAIFYRCQSGLTFDPPRNACINNILLFILIQMKIKKKGLKCFLLIVVVVLRPFFFYICIWTCACMNWTLYFRWATFWMCKLWMLTNSKFLFGFRFIYAFNGIDEFLNYVSVCLQKKK